MKLFSSLFLFAFAVFGQTSAPGPVADLPHDAVIASYQGKKLTVGELQNFMGALPPQMQQAAMRDRKSFVQQFFLMQHLSSLAEQSELDQTSPLKESLIFNRMYLLMNAELDNAMNSITVHAEDQKKFYEQNKYRFTQAKVKVLYVSFVANPPAGAAGAKKPLTEAEAKAKIEKIRADIRSGANFVGMVKRHSEDETSAAKEGDFGTIRQTDNIPEAIREAIFALKQGEISEPVRQPNGFYLFRADSVEPRPYDDVSDDIYNEIRQARFKEWMDEINRKLAGELKIENESFFGAGTGTGQ